MSSHDDPEARIRDLERALSEQSSELTQSYSETPPPPPAPPPPTYPVPQQAWAAQQPYAAPFPTVPTPSTGGGGRGWILYGVMAAVLAAIVGGAVMFFVNAFSGVNSIIDTFSSSPSASAGGGGGHFGAPPSPSGDDNASVPTIVPTPPIEPAGGNVSVAGVGDDKSIACNDSVVSVSGVRNTVVLTGQCASVTVSGVGNDVTVDSTGAIDASGFENHVIYRSGDPRISNSGDSNVVEQG